MSVWYEKGIQFKCQGSGKCCSSRGEYGYVYMTLQDRRNMAKALDLNTTEFTKKYCTKTSGVYHLNENEDSPDCLFLKNNKCSVYTGRPTQCRTWPFWPDNMNAKVWSNEIVSYCPGINKGRLYSKKEIDENLKLEADAENELFIS